MESRNVLVFSLILCISTTQVYCQYYSQTKPCKPHTQKVTNLHFFFHDILGGKDPSAVLVARANTSSKFQSATPFGTVFAVNDPLTVGPELKSGVIGSAQGMYVSSGRDALSLVVYFDFGFTTGKFNGSSISVFSRNPVLERERELTVVGGRGQFRMATGYALLKTYAIDTTTGDAIVEYNVTLIHY